MPAVWLREVEESDLDLLFAWAHIPYIWKYMTTRRKKEDLRWEDHLAWAYRSARRDGMRRDWMIVYGQRLIGVVHIEAEKHDPPEIGLFIADRHLWGGGVGRAALRRALVIAAELNYTVLDAFIHPKNKRSIKCFTSFNFRKTGGKINGLDIYRLDLSTTVRPTSVVPESEGRDRRSCQPCPA